MKKIAVKSRLQTGISFFTVWQLCTKGRIQSPYVPRIVEATLKSKMHECIVYKLSSTWSSSLQTIHYCAGIKFGERDQAYTINSNHFKMSRFGNKIILQHLQVLESIMNDIIHQSWVIIPLQGNKLINI